MYLTMLSLSFQRLRQQIDDEERCNSEIESYLRTHHDVSFKYTCRNCNMHFYFQFYTSYVNGNENHK